MRDAVLALLAPIRRRSQWQFALRALSLGMVLGALAGITSIIAQRALGRSLGPAAAWAVLLAGPVAGALLGLARRPSWQATAALVDDRCRLHDRASAALEFASNPSPSDLERLQVRDAVRLLTAIRPADVAPVRPPRGWPLAVGCLAIAVGLLAWPLVATPARSELPAPFEPALAEARALEEPARQLEAAAIEMQSAALKSIAERMRQTIAELKKPGLDMRETMAKISELQAFIAEAQKEYDPEPVDRELQSLGEVMVEARPLQPAAQALQEQRLEKAARALEEARSASFDRAEAQAIGPRLDRSAAGMKTKGLERLGRATSRLAAGVKGDAESLKQGTQELAKEIRDHDRRRRINELMAREQRRLSDCKNECEARNLMALRQQEEQQKPDPKKGSSGKGKTGKEGADADRENASALNRAKISGRAGDGPAETEDDGHSPQGNGTRARRPSRKVHQKYQRESEAVLDREPIPLGHREAIRRYFELIRPTSTAVEPAPDPGAGEGQR